MWSADFDYSRFLYYLFLFYVFSKGTVWKRAHSACGVSSPSSLTTYERDDIAHWWWYIDNIKVAASNGYDTLLYQPITKDSIIEIGIMNVSMYLSLQKRWKTYRCRSYVKQETVDAAAISTISADRSESILWDTDLPCLFISEIHTTTSCLYPKRVKTWHIQ